MAKHIKITIKVAYDAAHSVPSVDELTRNVNLAVGDGLLDDDGESVVEEWGCEVTEGSYES